jgi:hypothetical protein
MKKPIEGTIRVVKNKNGKKEIEIFYNNKFYKLRYICPLCGRYSRKP